MSGANTPEEMKFGHVQLRQVTRQLLIDGRPTRLGARAFDVLLALIERRERTVSKSELLDLVWPGLVVEENNLQVHVSALRKLVGPNVIATSPGRGYQFIARLEPALASVVPEPAAAVSANPYKLPTPRTQFIGRTKALAQCASLLQRTRLLTLTGIGGCGKTRLALQFAHQQQQLGHFAGGVCFVDLAPLQDVQRVAFAMAAALGVGEETATPLITQLIEKLADKRALIILDNCEHVLDAVVEVTDALLNGCAGLQIVATSRERLGVTGEQVLSVLPLGLPEGLRIARDGSAVRGAPRQLTRAAIQQAEAVQLFVDRARLVVPGFAVSDRNANAIAEVCGRLDGLALAIELAAARVKVLSVAELAARLDDRFRLLTGGASQLSRQQTLQATLQWSYDALSAAEQQLFCQLAVFVGGCTLAAIVHVVVLTAAPAEAATRADDYAVLELLTRLHDKSLLLVKRDGAGQPRYHMLETVREYALARLNETDEGVNVRDRHLRHYAVVADNWTRPRDQNASQAGRTAVHFDQENILAAHAWCAHATDGDAAGLRLVDALWRFWLSSSQLELGLRLANTALAQAGDKVPATLRCRALGAAARLSHHMGRYEDTLARATQILDLARSINDVEQTAIGLGLRADGLHASGQLAQALVDYEAACAIARTLAPTVLFSGLLNGLAEVRVGLGSFDDAANAYEEAIRVAHAFQDVGAIFVPQCNLARLSIASGALTRARELLLRSLRLAVQADMTGMGWVIPDFTAGLAATLDDHLCAARFAGAALARMQEAGAQRDAVDEAFIAPLLARSRSALGSEAFATALAVGQDLSHDEAMAEIEQWLARDE